MPFAFYEHLAEHPAHLRMTNRIELTLAAVRHRARRTKWRGERKL